MSVSVAQHVICCIAYLSTSSDFRPDVRAFRRVSSSFNLQTVLVEYAAGLFLKSIVPLPLPIPPSTADDNLGPPGNALQWMSVSHSTIGLSAAEVFTAIVPKSGEGRLTHRVQTCNCVISKCVSVCDKLAAISSGFVQYG